MYFYPRSPCGERPINALGAQIKTIFLSTLSLRRATFLTDVRVFREYFYPRSPCGERHQARNIVNAPIRISIHALLAESDPRGCPVLSQRPYFYPRSPCGERPAHFAQQIHSVGISIHALLAESDAGGAANGGTCCDFYPRSPCGERRCPPVGKRLRSTYFYPRSPCGERQDLIAKELALATISIHALLAESDSKIPPPGSRSTIFLSTLSLRRATAHRWANV